MARTPKASIIRTFIESANAVAPRTGLTGFAGGVPPETVVKDMKARIPNRRTNTPQDIGNIVAFLASDASSDVVAQNIGVDGGESVTQMETPGRKP